MKRTHLILILCIGLTGIPGLSRSQNPDIKHVGTITNPELGEISGIAPSRQFPDRLWCINDSKNPPALYLIGLDGRLHETWTVEGVVNDDWEEIGWIDRKGESLLFIADVGDNGESRLFVRIHMIRSEDLISDGTSASCSVATVYSFAFQYADGPKDCEAVSYDPERDRLLLISKRARPPVLYEIPLHPIESRALRKATRITNVAGFPHPVNGDNSLAAKFTEQVYQPTAMDLSPDQNHAAVLTYGPLLVFRRSAGTDWSSALGLKPVEIPLPFVRQSESVCYSPDGKFIYITSENLPAPIFRIELK